MATSCLSINIPPKSLPSSTFNGFLGYPTPQTLYPTKAATKTINNVYGFHSCRIRCGLLPVDPWAPTINSQSMASQLFAVSLFPYLGFLYYITKSKTAPKLTLVGFYFLLVFVGATIPAGIYAKGQYGTSLANVDWLHGGAESLLTITNLLVVLGLREGLKKTQDVRKEQKKKQESSS